MSCWSLALGYWPLAVGFSQLVVARALPIEGDQRAEAYSPLDEFEQLTSPGLGQYPVPRTQYPEPSAQNPVPSTQNPVPSAQHQQLTANS